MQVWYKGKAVNMIWWGAGAPPHTWSRITWNLEIKQTFYQSHLVWSSSGRNHTLFQWSPILAAVLKQASIERSVCMHRYWRPHTHTKTHIHIRTLMLHTPQLTTDGGILLWPLPGVRCPPSCRLSAIWTIKKGEVKLNKWQLDGNGILSQSSLIRAVLETFLHKCPFKQLTRPHHCIKEDYTYLNAKHMTC